MTSKIVYQNVTINERIIQMTREQKKDFKRKNFKGIF